MRLRLTFQHRIPYYDDLLKAVSAHHSQVQQRAGGKFAKFHPSRVAPRDEKGRFIGLLEQADRSAAEQHAKKIQVRLAQMLARHQQDVEVRRLDPKIAAARGREDIKDTYEQLYRAGMQSAGNPGLRLTSQDVALINRTAEDEAQYFTKFMEDVSTGSGKMDYGKRLSMYEPASRHAFWSGFVMGNQRKTRRILWQLGPTEHCYSCLYMNRLGTIDIPTFIKEGLKRGWVPQSGDLDCKGVHCQCRLETMSD